MKLLKRLVLAGIALVVLLGLIAYFTIKIAFPPEKIRQLVREQGKALVGREVNVGDVSIRLFPNLMVSVQHIQLANAEGFSKQPAVQVQEIVLSIHFMSLLRLSPDINEIKLVQPEILFEVDANGRNNFEGLGGEKKAEPETDTANKPIELPAAMALRSFVIHEGRVRYHDLQSRRELVLDQINQKVSLELDPALRNAQTQGRLQISEIKVNDAASGLRKGNVRISLNHDIRLDLPGEKLKIKALELGFQDIKVSVSGEVSQFMKGQPALNLAIAAPKIDLASVLKEVPASLSPEIPKLALTGNAAFDFKIQGVVDTAALPGIRGEFRIENAAASHRDVPVGITGLGMQVLFADDTVSLPQLKLQMGENPVSITAKLHGWQKQNLVLEDLNVNATVELDPLVSLAQRMGFMSDSMVVSGLVKAALRAEGPLDPQRPEAIKASGLVEMQKVSVKTTDLPVGVQVDGKTQFDNDRIKQDSKLLLGQSDIAVQSEVQNWQALVLPKQAKGARAKVVAKVQSNHLDLDELKPKTTTVDTTTSAPMKRYPDLPPVDAQIDVSLARTRLMGLDMTAFTAKSKLAGHILTSDLKGQLYTGGFTSGLKVDLKDSTNADVGLKLNLNKVEANDFISRINDQLPGHSKLVKGLSKLDSAIFGKLNLNLDVQTSGMPQDFAQNLTGAILFLLADGKILQTGLTSGLSGAMNKAHSSLGFKDMTFGLFKLDLAAENGRLLVRDAKVNESPVGMITAKGSVGLDNTLALQIDQALPPAASKAVLGTTGAVSSTVAKMAGVAELGQVGLFPKDAQGRALLYYAVGGTVTNPDYKLDVKRMATEANAGVKSALSAAVDAKKAELKAKLDAEKEKLEAQAKAKADSVRQALEAKAEAEKQKAVEGAKSKVKDEAKKKLKGLGL